MLKLVGWLFIIFGALLTVTIIFAGFGVPLMGFGVAILVAVALVDRHAKRVAEQSRRYDR